MSAEQLLPVGSVPGGDGIEVVGDDLVQSLFPVGIECHEPISQGNIPSLGKRHRGAVSEPQSSVVFVGTPSDLFSRELLRALKFAETFRLRWKMI